MTRKSTLWAMTGILLILVDGLVAAGRDSGVGPVSPERAPWAMKLRVLEGQREGAAQPSAAVTASYAGAMPTIGYLSDTNLPAEMEQIRRTFNLKAVRLLTETELAWVEGRIDKTSHTFRLDGSEYVVKVTAQGESRRHPFGIKVLERTDKTALDAKTSLLDIGFTLPDKMSAPIVFGFENREGTPFFVCLDATPRLVEEIVVVEDQRSERIREFAKGAVPAEGDIQPPMLLKMVEPIYPQAAVEKKIEGVVILSAKIAEDGKVIDAMVLRSVPGLDEAALAAVKQWVYEPMTIKGKPVKVIFTVTVRFTLKERP